MCKLVSIDANFGAPKYIINFQDLDSRDMGLKFRSMCWLLDKSDPATTGSATV